MQPVNPRGGLVDLLAGDKHAAQRTIEPGEELATVPQRQFDLPALRRVETLAERGNLVEVLQDLVAQLQSRGGIGRQQKFVKLIDDGVQVVFNQK